MIEAATVIRAFIGCVDAVFLPSVHGAATVWAPVVGLTLATGFTGGRGLPTDLAEDLGVLLAVVEIEVTSRGVAVSASALFGRHKGAGTALHDGDALAELGFVFFLQLPPVVDRTLWLQVRRLSERQSRVDAELAVVRRTVLGRLQFHLT